MEQNFKFFFNLLHHEKVRFLQTDKNIIAFWPSPRPHTSLSITEELLGIEKFKVLITPPFELLSTLRDE